mgnify:CR=1 FL=1
MTTPDNPRRVDARQRKESAAIERELGPCPPRGSPRIEWLAAAAMMRGDILGALTWYAAAGHREVKPAPQFLLIQYEPVEARTEGGATTGTGTGGDRVSAPAVRNGEGTHVATPAVVFDGAEVAP